MSSQFDLVIRGATVVDGSGDDPFESDVGIRGAHIAAISKHLANGREEIDGRGKLLTPGFVDIHTHYDGQAIWAERVEPSALHGVTTVVAGNCGVGFAPCRAADHAMLIDVMEGVEDIPEIVMTHGLTWDWETFPQFLDTVENRRRDINMAFYLPHSPLRVYVMGKRGADREPATEADLQQMQAIAREAIGAGALGFSTSRTMFHRTGEGDFIPSYGSGERELQAVGQALKDCGQGIIQVVSNSPVDSLPDELALFERLALSSNRPVTFLMPQRNDAADEWRDAFASMARANARPGVKLLAQVLPRPIGMIVSHSTSTNPFALCPSYEPLAQLPLKERIVALRQPEIRKRLLSEGPAVGKSVLYTLSRNFDRMFVLGDPPNYEPALESSVANRAQRINVSPEELAYDLLLEQDGNALLYLAISNYPRGNLDDSLEMMRHTDTVLGLGDGGAHYGIICDASYPTFILTHWTRDRAGERVSLPWAVKALAWETAQAVGLHDRGLVACGYKADLNLIDYDALTLRAPKMVGDLPGGGRRLNQLAKGYTATIVNGAVTYRDGEPTGALSGRLVRGAQRHVA
jgi:N-acyl-D-amino-acid deacylase